jgi:Mg-chelatase subunit ChlD
MAGLLVGLAIAAAVRPDSSKEVLRIPVWADTKDPSERPPLGEKGINGKIDGEPAPVVAVRGPGEDLVVMVVLDLTEEMALAEVAKDALLSAIQGLPLKAHVALLRAQDGLHVLLDPTADRAAASDTIRALPLSGKAGLLDTVELAAHVGDSMLRKADVRVAVVYVTDSNIYNYREDFINPVINSSDQHDMSRYFPEGLIREKISKLEAKLALSEAPLFIIHVAYRSDRMNEAYQAGLLQLASTCGGSSVFCRSRTEVPEAIASTLRTVATHYSVLLRLPKRPAKVVQVQLEAAGHELSYRNRFVIQR